MFGLYTAICDLGLLCLQRKGNKVTPVTLFIGIALEMFDSEITLFNKCTAVNLNMPLPCFLLTGAVC